MTTKPKTLHRRRARQTPLARLAYLISLANLAWAEGQNARFKAWIEGLSPAQRSSFEHQQSLKQAVPRHMLEVVGEAPLDASTTPYYNLSTNSVPEKIEDEVEQDVQLHMLNAVKPFSALRDTKEGKLRIFFDAQLWIAGVLTTCIFDNGIAAGEGRQELQSEGQLFSLSGNNPFLGYMLEFEDPGHQFDHVVMLFNGMDPMTPLYRIKLTELEYLSKGVGMCTAPLFSKRQAVLNWANDAVQAGISDLYVYFTDIPEKLYHNRLFGVHMGVGATRFVPEPHPAVSYYYYQSSAGSSYFSQTTFLNECLYRNRHTHSYILFADVDEYISVKQQGPVGMPPGQVLEMLLQSLFPGDAASMIVDVIPYPDICQAAFQDGIEPPASTSVAMNSHNFEFGWPLYRQTKYFAVPTRVQLAWVHSITSPMPGFRPYFLGPTGSLFVKHVRYSARGAVHICKATISDEDEAAFQKRITQNTRLMSDANT